MATALPGPGPDLITPKPKWPGRTLAQAGLALVDTWPWLVCPDRPRLSLSSRGSGLVMLAEPVQSMALGLGLVGLTTP